MRASGKPLIMGILNVTPDSFSDGREFLNPDNAVAHAVDMAREGADIIDVGSESTRPGAQRVNAVSQRQRLSGVFESLREKLPGRVVLSVDTTLSAVAEMALDNGATMVNDISAGRDDPEMFALCAERGAYLVLMHMQGEPATMQDDPVYDDVVSEVSAFLEARVQAAIDVGMSADKLLLDPGIGFGKTRAHNLALLAGLERIVALGYPVLLGASRKRFMGSLLDEASAKNLVAVTCATTALGVLAGVRVFRVHDVAANRQAADVAHAIMQS